MTDEKIARMANQIARAFASQGPDAAAAALADHVNKFWEPRLRDRLHACVAAGGAGLAPEVLAAAPAIRPGRRAAAD